MKIYSMTQQKFIELHVNQTQQYVSFTLIVSSGRFAGSRLFLIFSIDVFAAIKKGQDVHESISARVKKNEVPGTPFGKSTTDRPDLYFMATELGPGDYNITEWERYFGFDVVNSHFVIYIYYFW